VAHLHKDVFEKDLGKSLYCNQNAFFSPKRRVKVRTNKSAAHSCTKKLRVKCWWNWQLILLFLFEQDSDRSGDENAEDPDIAKIKKVQSFFRGWLCRRRSQFHLYHFIAICSKKLYCFTSLRAFCGFIITRGPWML